MHRQLGQVFILHSSSVPLTRTIRNIMISSSTLSPPKKRSRTDPVVSVKSTVAQPTVVESNGSANGKMPVPNHKPMLEITKLTEDAITPTRGSVESAGLDLYSSKEAWIPALGKALVSTGLSIALPDGCYGRVAPRSGLSSKHFVDVGAGVIDQDYRGEVKVLLFNFNRVDYHVKKGDRIAQLICEKIYIPEIRVVKELSATERGEGGFGSTGRN